MPLHKGLPWCTAVYETWFTEATLIEIGVSNAGVIFVDGEMRFVCMDWGILFSHTHGSLQETCEMRDNFDGFKKSRLSSR